MEEQNSLLDSIPLIEPMGPGIKDLKDTYPWQRFLQGVNATPLFRALLPVMRGAIFTGSAGNGRHTQAFALAYSLIEQSLRIPGAFEKSYIMQIDPSVLSPSCEEDKLAEYVDELYELVEGLLEHDLEAVAIMFDQIDLYPRSFMDRIAENLSNLESEHLFVICIGENESRISRNLQRKLPHCRCLMPSLENRRKYLRQIELIEVEDCWTDSLNPTKKKVAVEFEEITMDEIVKMTEGCSYADLQDLLWLIKLGMSTYDFEEFAQKEKVVIHVQRESVLEAIKFCKSTEDRKETAQVVSLQQPLYQGYPIGSESIQQNVPVKITDDDEGLSVDQQMEKIIG